MKTISHLLDLILVVALLQIAFGLLGTQYLFRGHISDVLPRVEGERLVNVVEDWHRGTADTVRFWCVWLGVVLSALGPGIGFMLRRCFMPGGKLMRPQGVILLPGAVSVLVFVQFLALCHMAFGPVFVETSYEGQASSILLQIPDDGARDAVENWHRRTVDVSRAWTLWSGIVIFASATLVVFRVRRMGKKSEESVPGLDEGRVA